MDKPLCGARKKQGGGTCKRGAGWGTDHPGQGRCKAHGGATPITHGRYSKVQRVRVRELLDELAKDPDPFDLEEEARLVRALTVDFVERYDERVSALQAWNDGEVREADGEGKKARPQRIPELHDVAKLAEMVSRIIERAQKVKDKSALTLETLSRIMEAMGTTVAKHVKDPATLKKIEEEWGEIRV